MPHAEPPATTVELIWLKDRLQRWVRFGRPIGETVNDRRRRTVTFAPGAVFALVQWEAGDYGTTLSRLWVLRAIEPGEPFGHVPFVTPGAEILLDLKTWVKARAGLEAIDAVDALGINPERVCPDHWRHVGGRIAVAEPPSPYSRARHRAWLSRKRLGLADGSAA
ncbi:DUF2840 domain-containing protein [Caulobacter sp. UNC279MFTsu5.1]|uniref:DUF2840 domain-containing protein n=1 Tax=Caulobacter sp. UNC279MFTsu5.1 TaxID=1502775 RepID=UPI00035D9A32|nr:DUF2840 domain-containing protein [Caulobacter sp. UNC279MFTsu5.1]SFK75296.1 Protein of unknown function [Caulobacter sp. UNC279MFTsu5.1]